MAKAPAGGLRVGGVNYPSGATIPERYSRNGQKTERLRDPAIGNVNTPPNMGRLVVPTVMTFSGMITSLSKAYRYSDEAMRHSIENAHAMLNDPVIQGPLLARQGMVALLNWSIESENDDEPQLKEASIQLTKIINRTPRFTEYRRALLEAVWYGRYACQNAFGFHYDSKGVRTRVVRKWSPISGDKLLFRYDDGSGQFDPDQIGIRMTTALGKDDLIAGRRKLEATGEGMGYFLEPWERRHVVVHKHMIRDGEYEDPISGGQIHGVGLRHFLYWVWYQKQETMAQIAEIVERTGAGFTIYFYPEGNPQARAEVEKVSREQAHTNVILMPTDPNNPEAYSIQQIPPNTQGLTVLQDFVERFLGDMVIRFILGQTMSTKPDATGMGSGLADLQKDTLFQIARYDAVNLEETITSELLLPLRDFNFPKLRNVDFFFKISTKVSAPEQELQAIYQAWNMGAEIKATDLMDKLDLAMPGPKDKTLFNPQIMMAIKQLNTPQPQPGMGGPPGAPPGAAPGGPAGPDGGGAPPEAPPGAGPDDGGQGDPPPADDQPDGDPEQMDKQPDEDKKRLFGPILYAKEWKKKIEQAASETEANPSTDQRKTGNYRKGRVWVRGIEIAIESPKGSKRRPEWQPMACHYGYVSRLSLDGSISGPDGKDGDKVDCYLGPDVDSEVVFVIDQVTESGRFDEHKVCLFCKNGQQAKELYLANYPSGWKCGMMTALTWDQFRSWLIEGDTTKPINQQPLRYGRQFNLFPMGGEHQPGELMFKRGKTYELNQNHRWELKNEPKVEPIIPTPSETLSEDDNIDGGRDADNDEESYDADEQAEFNEPESEDKVESESADDGRRGHDDGRSASSSDSGRTSARLVTSREEFTRRTADAERIPGSLRRHLAPHQELGVALALESLENVGGFLLADGTGAGKTRQILSLAKIYSDLGLKVLIVAPSEVIKPNWEKRTIAGSYADDGKLLEVPITLDNGSENPNIWTKSPKYYTSAKEAKDILEDAKESDLGSEFRLSFDQTAEGPRYSIEKREKNKNLLKPGKPVITSYGNVDRFLNSIDDNTIVMYDESHALKNGDSIRAMAGNEGSKRARSVLYATATPCDKPLHIDYLFRMGLFEGKAKEVAYRDLGLKEYSSSKKLKDGTTRVTQKWKIDPAVGADEVLKRISSLFDRLTQKGNMIKREVSMEGVPVEFAKVKLPQEAHDVMKKIENELTRGVGLEETSGLLKARVLGHQRRQQETYKIDAAVKMAKEELEAGRQVVIFMARVNFSQVKRKDRIYYGDDGDYEEIETLIHESEGTIPLIKQALMEQTGLKEDEIAQLHGKIKQQDATTKGPAKPKAPVEMAKFQSGKAKLIIATIESGGTGINLDDRTGNAPRTMIIITPPFSGNENVQAVGRIIRMSTKSLSKVRYVFADTPVDAWNMGIIGNKMKMLGAAVSGELERLDIPELTEIGEGEVLSMYGTEAKRKKKDAADARQQSLPGLAGSVKQNKWAASLRKNVLKAVDKYIKDNPDAKLTVLGGDTVSAKSLLAHMERIASAKWWIDNARDSSPEQVLRSAGRHADKRFQVGTSAIRVATDYGEPIVERLRMLGATWDRDYNAWSVPLSKKEQLQALLREVDGPHHSEKYSKSYAQYRRGDNQSPLFDGEKLNGQVTAHLRKIARDFIAGTAIPRDAIQDVVLTGSMASGGWTPQSDIDVHITVDADSIPGDPEMVRDYLYEVAANWNAKHSIKIMGHEVELFVEPVELTAEQYAKKSKAPAPGQKGLFDDDEPSPPKPAAAPKAESAPAGQPDPDFEKKHPRDEGGKFKSAGQAAKEGLSYADWQQPVYDAFRNEEIDDQHPAWKSIEAGSSPKVEDYNDARDIYGHHVKFYNYGTNNEEFGTVTDIDHDAKAVTVTKADGSTYRTSPRSLDHLGAVIRDRLKRGRPIDDYVAYVTPLLEKEAAEKGEDLSETMKRHGVPAEVISLKPTTIKAGDSVTIKPEWQDHGDEGIEWKAIDNPEKGRVTIEAQLDMPIKPTQSVNTEWLEAKTSAAPAQTPKKGNVDLFGEALKPAPPKQATFENVRGKQDSLFAKEGLAGQMNLFADKAVPDDMLSREQREKRKQEESQSNYVPFEAGKPMQRNTVFPESGQTASTKLESQKQESRAVLKKLEDAAVKNGWDLSGSMKPRVGLKDVEKALKGTGLDIYALKTGLLDVELQDMKDGTFAIHRRGESSAPAPSEPSKPTFTTTTAVYGHPSNGLNRAGHDNLIPIKIDGNTDLSWRHKAVQSRIDEIQTAIGKANAQERSKDPKQRALGKAFHRSANTFDMKQELEDLKDAQKYLHELETQKASLGSQNRKYWYGMHNRPIGHATVPKGFSETTKHDAFRHGAVGYDRPLTEQEQYDYELTPIRHESEIPAVAKAVAGHMGDYVGEYLKPENAEILNDKLSHPEVRKAMGHVDVEKVKAELLRQYSGK